MMIRFDSVVQIPPGGKRYIQVEVRSTFKGRRLKVMDPSNTHPADLLYDDLNGASFEFESVRVGDTEQMPEGAEYVPASMFIGADSPPLSMEPCRPHYCITITIINIGDKPRHFVADLYGVG